MADNVTIPASGTGTATPVVATDDVAGVHYQKVKLDVGGDGASTPVNGTIPVSGTVTVTEPVSVDDNGGSLTVDGSVSVTGVLQQETLTSTGTLGVLDATVALATTRAALVGVSVSGTWVGTIYFEATRLDTPVWFQTSAATYDGTISSETTSNSDFTVPVLGYKQVRVRMQAYTSGTATIEMVAIPNAPGMVVGANGEILDVFPNLDPSLSVADGFTGSLIQTKSAIFLNGGAGQDLRQWSTAEQLTDTDDGIYTGAVAPVMWNGTKFSRLQGNTTNGLDVDVTRIAAGDNNIGNVDIVTVPADPFGGNADAASATGSMSAKLRFIAATGIPVTSLPALAAGSANIGDVDVLTLPKSGTATLTNVSDTATSTTLLSANAARLGASIHNDSTVVLYVKFGTTASATSFTVKMAADAHYEVPFGFTGRIDGIWASDASGAARITEFT